MASATARRSSAGNVVRLGACRELTDIVGSAAGGVGWVAPRVGQRVALGVNIRCQGHAGPVEEARSARDARALAGQPAGREAARTWVRAPRCARVTVSGDDPASQGIVGAVIRAEAAHAAITQHMARRW
eukprot:CAMPEP_0181201632 /NCGR_PEP_ID=MMETSP1096-20121128/18411_1 /TAXON_ID=156174 ORGANISM="Chrysochromulina ericina, Strain CCMP281" /NCGR_SAMPLE_ID=MMETSP1096 /ASSEMBLY_ACC=CAM_ASM_000453 /LENGTH=128 /DNA_ID=CAMNT_0023292089 /DNA_START=412 /DNA_END=799 /DNA_ORIENTATION=-